MAVRTPVLTHCPADALPAGSGANGIAPEVLGTARIEAEDAASCVGVLVGTHEDEGPTRSLAFVDQVEKCFTGPGGAGVFHAVGEDHDDLLLGLLGRLTMVVGSLNQVSKGIE